MHGLARFRWVHTCLSCHAVLICSRNCSFTFMHESVFQPFLIFHFQFISQPTDTYKLLPACISYLSSRPLKRRAWQQSEQFFSSSLLSTVFGRCKSVFVKWKKNRDLIRWIAWNLASWTIRKTFLERLLLVCNCLRMGSGLAESRWFETAREIAFLSTAQHIGPVWMDASTLIAFNMHMPANVCA
jgi:hypothetical protein